MKRILFATDFSDSCQNAFKYVKKLVRNSKTKVGIIHVFDIPVSILSSVSFESGEHMLRDKRNRFEETLEEWSNQLEEENRGGCYCINGMYPSTEIAELAAQNNVDLIVMALRQKYSLIDRMIGSVTAHTIQKSDIPVLAVPNGADYKHVSNILFPTSISADRAFNDSEREAIEWLFSFYEYIEKPKVHMIQIQEVDQDIEFIEENLPFPSMDFIRTKATSVDEGIIQYLEGHDIDILAFYKPNRSFWERLYHSSITRKLLFKSRIPLLVF